MPTSVPGNPTGVATPAALPGPDTFVVTSQPIAGEGDTAASVNQAFTALGNEQAWLKDPRAAAPASPGALDAAYVQPIKKAKNVRLLRRDFTDHRGFDHLARITRWQENWEDVAFLTPKTASGHWAKAWNAFVTLGSSTTAQILAQVGSPFIGGGANVYAGSTLILDTGAVPGPGACILALERQGGIWTTNDSDMVFQWDIGLGAPGGGGVESVVGLFVSASAATGLFASTSPIGFGIYSGPGHATHCALYTCDGISAPVFTDLGAAGDASTRFRIEWQGVNASDDSTARVLVYGDGDLTKPLVNKAVNFVNGTYVSTALYLQPFFRLMSQGGREVARYGVTDFAAARVAGDIAY